MCLKRIYSLRNLPSWGPKQDFLLSGGAALGKFSMVLQDQANREKGATFNRGPDETRESREIHGLTLIRTSQLNDLFR
jgi:hypothetical protein